MKFKTIRNSRLSTESFSHIPPISDLILKLINARSSEKIAKDKEKYIKK